MRKPSQTRKLIGVLLVMCSFVVSGIVGVQVHRETKALRVDMDVMYSVLNSDIYPLAVLDEHGKVVRWNPAMEQLTGVSETEAATQGFSDICDPVKIAKHNQGLTSAFLDKGLRGKLLIVHCDVTNKKTHQRIPVRVSARLVPTGVNSKDFYAVARIDRQSEVEEVTTHSVDN